MNCKLCQHEIDQIELGQAFNREAAKHLESCGACRSFKNERESLRILLASLERVAAPANFDSRLRARLLARSEKQPRAVWFLQPSFLRVCYVSLPLLLIVISLSLTHTFVYSPDSDKSLNGVSSLSSINIDQLKADNIRKREEQTPLALNEKVPRVETEKHLKGLQNKINREKPVSVDLSQNNALAQIPPEFGGSAIIIPIRPESRSHYVIVNDKKIPLRSVTFGSQNLMSGNEPRAVFTSSAQRVW